MEQQQQSVSHEILKYKSKIWPNLRIIGEEEYSKVAAIVEDQNRAYKIIGTHSGQFHCDEVLATTMLLYTNTFGVEKDPLIIRTRNEQIMEKMDLLCDVGSVFDAEKLRFDHHQQSFNDCFQDNCITKKQAEEEKKEEGKSSHVHIKLSSAGLIYKYYGKEVIRNILKDVWSVEYSEDQLQKIYDKLYKSFILEIDAIDNGVQQFARKAKYNLSSHLSARINKYNKTWNAPADVDQQERFRMAMKVTEEEFIWQLNSVALVGFPARIFCEQAWAKKEEIHPSGSFFFLENFCPWDSHMKDIETDLKQPNTLKYAIFKDERGMFRIQSMKGEKDFSSRAPLAVAWRGLRGKELQEISGINDIEFVHHAGFIGGAWSFESAIKMGEVGLKELEEREKLPKEE